MSDPITVAIVDDDPIVRNSLMSLLSRAAGIRPVVSFDDGAPAVDYASSHAVDVYLVDLNMRTMDGYTTTTQLREISPASEVIILTSIATPRTKETVATLGAAAFLRKTALPADIVSTIYSVCEGTSSSKEPRRYHSDSPARQLSEREIEVLTLLGHGMSNEEISNSLVLSESAVKKHITSILNKLEAKSRLEAVIKSVELGLIDLQKLDGTALSDTLEN